MNIVVFGATGDVGSRVVREALLRGHKVTAVIRDQAKINHVPNGAATRVLDVNEPGAVLAALTGQDLAVSAIRPVDGKEYLLPELTKRILDASIQTHTRVLIVGGAANLLMPDGSGHTVLTAPGFLPDDVRPIAAACFKQFAACADMAEADWSYFSPPAMLMPGIRTGKYRRGTDMLLTDSQGESKLSMEDFSVAMLDEAESPSLNNRRITVAY
ncbi:MAG: NAD(P)H-binding protein [Pseudomonadota bacterium]